MTERLIYLPEYHPRQAQVVSEASRFNVCMLGRRWGKTTLGERLGEEPALEGEPVGWFAPTYKYLTDAMDRMRRALSPAVARLSKMEMRIELKTGGAIDFWTLDNPDAGRGRKYKRAIIDEAGLVRNFEEVWWKAIRPTLSDLRGDAWFFGTPKGRRFFYQLYLKGQSGDPDWRSWQLPTSDNPYIPADEIEDARRSLPRAAFEQEYLAIPDDNAGNPFGVQDIHDAINPSVPRGEPVAFGVDLAKSVDWTVVQGIDEAGNLLEPERWQGVPWGTTMDRIIRLVRDVPTLVDATGLGDPIVEQLQSRANNVQGFIFTSKSKQQLMEGLAAAIQQREIGLPDTGWLIAEYESFEFTYTASGVKYSAPQGLHDDGVCASGLAVKQWRDRITRPLEVRVMGEGKADGGRWDDW